MKIGSVAFLVVLGGTASTMPQRLSHLSALAEGLAGAAPAAEPNVGDLVAQRQARPGTPEVGFGTLIEADGGRRLEAFGLQKALEADTHLRGKDKVIRNPLIDSLLGMGKGTGARAAPALPLTPPSRTDVLRWRPSKEAAAWLSSAATWGLAALLTIAVVLAIVDLKGAARALAGACHWVTGNWLILLSGAGLGLRYAWRVDVWGLLPGEFCWAPAAAVLASAGILRVLDMNEPVWNKTVLALAAPVLSGVVVPLLS